MRHTALATAIVFIAFAVQADEKAESTRTAAAADESQSKARPRDGVWKPIAAVLAGRRLPDAAVRAITLRINGGKYEVTVAGEDEADIGTVTFDTSTTPHRMTIKSTAGPNQGKTILAIYEMKNRVSLRVCYDLSGNEFPTDFKAPKGTQRYAVGYRHESRTPWVVLLSPKTKSLDEHWKTTGNWNLKDGVITLTPRAGEQGWSRFSDYLWSNKEYGDFEIEFEYKLEQKGNSGFYFRVGDVKDPVQQGIEVQIYDTHSKGTDVPLTDHDAGGIIPGLIPHRRAAKPAGEWNKMSVWHSDKRIVVMLNGINVNAHDLIGGGQLAQRPPTGPIGFQDHALPISLRNIRIRPVPVDEVPRRKR